MNNDFYPMDVDCQVEEARTNKECRQLVLHHRNLSLTFPDMAGLDHIKEIFIPRCCLTSFPGALFRVPHLEFLDLSGNYISTLPADFPRSWSSSLVLLDLSHNSLNVFPKSLLQLTGLKELYLGWNQIGLIQNSPIGDGESPGWELEYPRGDASTTIPSDIARLVNLSVLVLGNNLVESVPRSLCFMNSLSKLDISSNVIRHLPGDFLYNRLKPFAFANNRFITRPMLEDFGSYRDIPLWETLCDEMVGESPLAKVTFPVMSLCELAGLALIKSAERNSTQSATVRVKGRLKSDVCTLCSGALLSPVKFFEFCSSESSRHPALSPLDHGTPVPLLHSVCKLCLRAKFIGTVQLRMIEAQKTKYPVLEFPELQFSNPFGTQFHSIQQRVLEMGRIENPNLLGENEGYSLLM